MVALIREAWIGGMSTRRVDELVQAMGLSGISKSSPDLPASAGRNLFDFGAGAGVDFQSDDTLDNDGCRPSMAASFVRVLVYRKPRRQRSPVNSNSRRSAAL